MRPTHAAAVWHVRCGVLSFWFLFIFLLPHRRCFLLLLWSAGGLGGTRQLFWRTLFVDALFPSLRPVIVGGVARRRQPPGRGRWWVETRRYPSSPGLQLRARAPSSVLGNPGEAGCRELLSTPLLERVNQARAGVKPEPAREEPHDRGEGTRSKGPKMQQALKYRAYASCLRCTSQQYRTRTSTSSRTLCEWSPKAERLNGTFQLPVVIHLTTASSTHPTKSIVSLVIPGPRRCGVQPQPKKTP